jgi:hypothetical protein
VIVSTQVTILVISQMFGLGIVISIRLSVIADQMPMIKGIAPRSLRNRR